MKALGFVIFPLLLLLPGLFGCGGGNDLSFPTEYQAVFLDNGQVFFGRLAGADSSFLTLREVFYVQRVTDGEKKEARNVLVKRGSEWHGPDFMRINNRHVVLIEPVAPDSLVARLIREAKAAPAAAGPVPAPGVAPPPAAAPGETPPKGEKKAAPARR